MLVAKMLTNRHRDLICSKTLGVVLTRRNCRVGYYSIQRVVVGAWLLAAVAGIALPQGVTLQSSPSSLTFNIASGATPPTQDITISSSTNQAVAVLVSPGTGVV